VQFLSPNSLLETGIFPRYRKRRFKSPRLIKIRLFALGASAQFLYLNLEEVPTSIIIGAKLPLVHEKIWLKITHLLKPGVFYHNAGT